MKTGSLVVVFAIVSLCVVVVARKLNSSEETDEISQRAGFFSLNYPVDAIPRSIPAVITHISSFLNTPSYNYTLAPIGEVVDADGTPIEKPLNGDIVLHNLRVLQAMVEKHERMYQFSLENFGCKPYDHGRNCFKE